MSNLPPPGLPPNEAPIPINGTFPSSLPPLPGDIIISIYGPGILSLFFQALETGLLLAQCAAFWVHALAEPRVVKALVVWVTAVACAQTCSQVWPSWVTSVLNFGKVIGPRWPDLAGPAITSLMAAPIQAFYIWRCGPIVKWNLFVLVPCSAVLIASVVTSALATNSLFRNVKFGAIEAQLASPSPPSLGSFLSVPYVLSLLCPAVLDIVVTGILFNFLFRSLSRVYKTSVRTRVTGLIITSLEAAVPTTVCATATAVSYLVFTTSISRAPDQFWDNLLQAMLGKLYVISLFFTLRGRAGFSHVYPGGSTATTIPRMSTLTQPVAVGIDWTISQMSRYNVGTAQGADPEHGIITAADSGRAIDRHLEDPK
ncbi:hypothetical protein BC834DRAFT_971311 [Gloeopeniophorella convolvens]|nr:hypothetical protein BC834DRAFT_971311 [Gloeopeniophorella convolvens]